MRLKTRSSAVIAVAFAGLLIAAAPAQAAGKDIPYTYTNDDNPGGKATFLWDGDGLVVCDEQTDGYGVIATLYNSSGKVLKSVRDAGHDSTCYRNSDDIADGTGVRLTVCLYKGGIYNYFCRTSAWGVS